MRGRCFATVLDLRLSTVGMQWQLVSHRYYVAGRFTFGRIERLSNICTDQNAYHYCDTIVNAHLHAIAESHHHVVTNSHCHAISDPNCNVVTNSHGITDPNCNAITNSHCNAITDPNCNVVTNSHGHAITNSHCNAITNCHTATTPQPTATPVPTATPLPTPTATSSPTPTPRPPLPSIQPDFASIIEQGNLRYERRVRQEIDELREGMPQLARKIEGLSWVEDGIEGPEERGIFSRLISLADVGLTARLIEEPWVAEGRNSAAFHSLSWLYLTDAELFDEIMSHPALTDDITYRESKVLATLETTAIPVVRLLEEPDILDKLLDPERHTMEVRTIDLPLAGETELTIIRTRPGLDSTMDLLEHSVRSLEEFMGFPFPRRQVIVLFAAAPGGGALLPGHVQIRVREGLSHDTLVHELSHIYWQGAPNLETYPPSRWVTEGAAVFMEFVVQDTLQTFEADINHEFGRCTLAQNISEVEALGPVGASFQIYDCAYGMGARFFKDLYDNMGEDDFRLGFRRLFLHHRFGTGPCRTLICYVRESFTTFAPVEDLITRRYSG